MSIIGKLPQPNTVNTIVDYFMKNPIKLQSGAFAILAFSSFLPQAHGAVLASENFSSYSASTNLQGLNGGSGWNGGWAAGAPSFGYLNEVRNGAPVSYPNYVANGGNYANLASGYGGPSFNYVQRTVDVTGAFSAYNDGTRVGADNKTLWGSFLYSNVSGLQFLLQGSGNVPLFAPTTGANNLYLFRIDFGAGNADTISYWSNPNLTTWTPSATPTSTAAGNYSFQSLVFVAPSSTNEGRIDNILLGTQAIDVVPYVPEPSTYLLVTMAGAALVFRRRSRV